MKEQNALAPQRCSVKGTGVIHAATGSLGPTIPATELAVKQVRDWQPLQVADKAVRGLYSFPGVQKGSQDSCHGVVQLHAQHARPSSVQRHDSQEQMFQTVLNIKESNFERSWHCKLSSVFHIFHNQRAQTPNAKLLGP